ncbi:MAG TPA: DNA ligase D [Gammaproteobacteria bacterium]|jgi:bifunctional non-homologous end joining protein LigD
MTTASRRKLTTYRSKRDFHQTSEPAGKVGRKAGHSYLIQKHAARRLHYDFRLELDGVLKSWAVTRGPSLDPADKRLAVHVEDHPLAYGKFEGIIPKGQYGGGTVMLWDRGSWTPVGDPHWGYEKGHLSFDLQGERLKGRWHLVRMGGKSAGKKKENWLLIKSHDEYAKEGNGDYALEHHKSSVTTHRSMQQIVSGRSRRWDSGHEQRVVSRATRKPARKSLRRGRAGSGAPPEFVPPELATLVSHPPSGENWVHEIKFDGYRLLARIQRGKATLTTRAHNDWTAKFASIASALPDLHCRNALLDGEVVNQDDQGGMTFHGLQQALSAGRQGQLHYYVFDLLFLDGEDLQHRPLLERKALLKKLLKRAAAHVHYSEHFTAAGEDVLAHACDIALEGIVSKRADRPYHQGRSLDWMKSKCVQEQEVVIGGYTIQPRHPGTLAALLTGYQKDGALVYSGKVGTGFSQEDAAQVLKKLKHLGRKRSPFVSVPAAARRGACWVDPKLVAHMNFSEWTADGRMRHPSFQGLREDKPARDVVREKPKPPSSPRRGKTQVSKTNNRRKHAMRGDDTITGVTLSHPDKVLYPDSSITKRQLAEYYVKAAPRMLPQIAGRPISLMRCPGGEGKTCFFQRHVGDAVSPHLKPVRVAGRGGGEPYITLTDVAGLVTLVQRDVLEIHVWGSQGKRPERPDRLVFDFDPAPDVKFAAVKQAALQMRGILKGLKLESFLKTTGGKGLHVVVPFETGPGWDEVKDFSRHIAQAVAEHDPDHFTINSRKDVRHGRIFIDYLRNGLGASAVAPYSTRARPGAPVALPLHWQELARLKSGSAFTLQDALRRLRADPWAKLGATRQRLPIGTVSRSRKPR